jgi:hypothetical protein
MRVLAAALAAGHAAAHGTTVVAVTDAASCAAIVDRVDCSSGVGSKDSGFGMTQAFCEARGCCFLNATSTGGDDDDSNQPACFYPSEGADVEVVHMINSNHFDAGYADLTVAVANTYFDTYFPRAADIGALLRQQPATVPGAGPLKWMTFSWLVSLYLDCPAGYGLHCPSESDKSRVVNAIVAGDIVWAAFPHNAELATLDAAYLKFGVDMSQQLARQ